MLVGREVFSSLDEEYEKQVNEGSDVSLNWEDQHAEEINLDAVRRTRIARFLDGGEG